VTEEQRSGVLPVEKGPGVTSFQVVAHLRRVLRAQKIGHGGTLDPDATGVLPMLIGEATKLSPYLTELDKEYLATVRLGIATETQDMSGAVRETRPVPDFDAATIEAALGRFVGVIQQVPPMYSALHRDGRRLYELAREGQTVEREPRPVTVHAIILERWTCPSSRSVRCARGHTSGPWPPIWERLSCGGALAVLIRTRVGPYALADAVSWAEVREARYGAPLWTRLLPCDSALAAFPAIRLESSAALPFVHGQTVPAPCCPDGRARVYGPDGDFLGVGLAARASVKPERLLNADPARPRVLPV
jgi:tRNA pseudouridine55 synthase